MKTHEAKAYLAGETMWNVYVVKKKGGPKEQVNKEPMSQKDAEEMMADFEDSGIPHYDLSMDPVTATVADDSSEEIKRMAFLEEASSKLLETVKELRKSKYVGFGQDALKKIQSLFHELERESTDIMRKY